MTVRLMIAYSLMVLIAIGFVVMVMSIRYHSLSQRHDRAQKLAMRKQVEYDDAMAKKEIAE